MNVEFPLAMEIGYDRGVFIPDSLDTGEAEEFVEWMRHNLTADVLEHLQAYLHGERPFIVCLCGSTRFMEAFHAANRERSLRGEIVLTVEIATYDGNTDPQGNDPETKRRLDNLHLAKIRLADYILVLNVGGYIGESTAREIRWAEALGKPVEYLEPQGHPEQRQDWEGGVHETPDPRP